MAQNTGGLGGLGGFFQKPVVQDTLDAIFTSMISSPRNNVLAGFGQAYDASQDRRLVQQQNAAMEQALISAGMSPEQARMMAANPRAAQFSLEQQQKQREQEQAQAQRGKTYDFFAQDDPELAQMMDAGLPAADAFDIYVKKRNGGAGTEYGLVPQTGVDENGNAVMIQVGKNGTSVKTQLPEGVTLSKEPLKLDAGTHWILLDPITRQQIAVIPKENYKEAADTARGAAEGKAVGEDAATYESVASKMPGLEAVITKLDDLSNKATYTYGGQIVDWTRAQTGGVPREAAIARTEYTAIVDNQILPLLRDTFGAQFTVQEGEALRATLGAPNKTPAEKQAVLRAFIEQKRRDVEALGVRTGKVPASTSTKPVSEMSDEELEAVVNGG